MWWCTPTIPRLSTACEKAEPGKEQFLNPDGLCIAGVSDTTFRTFDHTCIVHSIWMMAWQMDCGMFVVRVPSKENLADDPSRERYGLLAGMKARL